MKRFWKENKVLVVLAIIIFISLVLMAVGLFTYFYRQDVTVYGNRLNEIEKHKVDDKLDEQIKAKFEKGIEKVKIDIKGKIIYIIMDVSADTTKAKAKEYAQTALSIVPEDTQNYYDIQFMMTKENEDKEEKEFPIIGGKSSSSSSIVWTNN